jgi:hypothetical protein
VKKPTEAGSSLTERNDLKSYSERSSGSIASVYPALAWLILYLSGGGVVRPQDTAR